MVVKRAEGCAKGTKIMVAVFFYLSLKGEKYQFFLGGGYVFRAISQGRYCTYMLLTMSSVVLPPGQEEEDEDETRKILDVSELSAEEARYLLDKLLTMTVNQTCLATQKEGRIRDGNI